MSIEFKKEIMKENLSNYKWCVKTYIILYDKTNDRCWRLFIWI